MKIHASLKLLIIFILLIPVTLLSAFFYIYSKIPTTKELRGCLTSTMHQVYLCPKSKNYVPLSRISNVLKKTVVLTEDSAFYQHHGFDWKSIEKSARENMEKGKYVRGGSTITQQLAKNLFLVKEKTLMRKFFEGLIALKLEKDLTKNEILEKYLNVIEFGNKIYGIEAASRHYFKKSAADLTAAESAFMAMLLPSPKKYSASFQKKNLTHFAEKRIQKILSDMFQYERIDLATYEQAQQQVPALFTPELMNLNPEITTNESETTDVEDPFESSETEE